MSQNRLLDMLNSAATPSPTSSPASSHLQPPAPPSAQGSSLISPPVGSPREPSPAPPPPSLQAVSLSDLFAGLTSPSSGTGSLPQAASPPPAGQEKGENHQASLLGMLRGLAAPAGAGDVSAGAKDKTLSGNNTPSTGSIGQVGAGVKNSPADHHTNLLNMFKSTPASSAPNQPVVTHPTGGSASSSSARPSPQPGLNASGTSTSNGSAKGQNGSVNRHVPTPPIVFTPPKASTPVTHTPPPAPAASASAAPSQPSKSMFDFVSPFDVFEKPKPKAQTPVQVEKKDVQSPAPAHGKAPVAPPASSSPAPAQAAQTKVSSPIPTQPAKATPQLPAGVKNEARQRQPSGSSSQGDGKRDLGLPWLVGKTVEKGSQGHGPQAGTAHVKVDLSKPNLDSLINAPGAVQVIPMTILRTDNPTFSKGRSVGITSSWVAYVLPKGRVRLINSTSGSRLVLQIPGVSVGTPIDVAVIADSVAIVGPDHSITVFKVPEHWDKDEPATELVTHISTPQIDAEGVGSPNRVEWVRKDGASFLAIGGDSGVIVVRPDQLKGERDLTLGHLESQHKVLQTEGALAAFCLNHSHQAIALISTKGHLTLYSVASLMRVWNRMLPASQPKPSAPSSVQFVEANILVGRENNTQLDLVQITTDIVVLSTIKLTAPSPSPAHLHFAQAVYDPNRTTLWVAPFARGSVYGFRYALKNQAPIKLSERPDVVAFGQIAEYPLEPITSLTVNARTADDDAELFFAMPNGFSMAHIEASALEATVPTPAATPAPSAPAQPAGAFAAPATVVSPPAAQATTEREVKKEKVDGKVDAKKAGGKAGKNATPSKGNSPAMIKQELPAATQPEPAKSDTTDNTANVELKRIVEEQFAQVNSRIDALRSGDFAGEISTKVEKALKGSLATAVQADLKRSLSATIASSVQNEIKSALAASAPQAVSAALAGLPKDLERALTPWIQRTVGSVVQTSVDRALDGVLQSTLLPAINASSARVAEQLSAEFKSEMVQIRKDFTHSRQETPKNDEALRTLIGLVGDLQRQVQMLSERSAAPAPPTQQPGLNRHQPPQQLQQQPQQPQPHQPSAGIPASARAAIEDHFMGVLTLSSMPATLQLVEEHFYMTEDLLPSPPGTSPLSQALLLTLSHRLSGVLAEIPQGGFIDPRVANWLKRLSHLVDVRNPDVAVFYGRVIPIVKHAMENATARVGGDTRNREAVRDLREAIEVFGAKL